MYLIRLLLKREISLDRAIGDDFIGYQIRIDNNLTNIDQWVLHYGLAIEYANFDIGIAWRSFWPLRSYDFFGAGAQ